MFERQIHLSSGGGAALQGYDGLLRFGYTKNRGIYALRVEADGEWQGMTLRAGTECKSAKLEILETEPELRVRVTLKEGKYHQVKRMFARVGCTVTSMHRTAKGALELDPTLAPGDCRALTTAEVAL